MRGHLVKQSDHIAGTNLKEIKDRVKSTTFNQTFIKALFFSEAKNQKESGHPSIREWLNKLQYLNIMEYYCTIRNDERIFHRIPENRNKCRWKKQNQENNLHNDNIVKKTLKRLKMPDSRRQPPTSSRRSKTRQVTELGCGRRTTSAVTVTEWMGLIF